MSDEIVEDALDPDLDEDLGIDPERDAQFPAETDEDEEAADTTDVEALNESTDEEFEDHVSERRGETLDETPQIPDLDDQMFDALTKDQVPDEALIRAKFLQEKAEKAQKAELQEFIDFQKDLLDAAGYDTETKQWRQRTPVEPETIPEPTVADIPELGIAAKLSEDQFAQLMDLTAASSGGGYVNVNTVDQEVLAAYRALAVGEE